MVFFKIKLLLASLLVLSGQFIFSQDSISIGLNDAIELALQKNTDVVIANYQVNTIKFSLKEAKGNFLPKVYLNANYNRNIDQQVLFLSEASTATKLGSDNDYSSSLNLTLPLYSNSNFANKKIAETGLDFQNELSRGIQQSVINATKKSYFNYLIIQEVVEVQKSRLQNAQDILQDIQKRLDKGTLTEYDLTSAKVQVANAKNNLLEAQSNIIPAANNLKLLLGLKSNDNLILTEPITLIEDELTLKGSIDQMLKQNSRLKQLDIDVKLNKKQINLVKSAYYPTLNAIGNYNYQAQANDFKVSNYNWVNTSLVGMQLQFSIFNGTITKNKVQQAVIAKKIAEEEKENAIREYRMQFDELLSQLEFSRQKVTVLKENMNLTTNALALAKKRYLYGIGTFLEVNDAELMYTQARLNWLQAISDYKSTYYDYQLLIGKE